MVSVVFAGDHLAVDEVARRLRADDIDLGDPSPVQRTRYDTFDGRLEAAGLRLEARAAGSGHSVVLRGGAGSDAHLYLAGPLTPEVPLGLTALPRGPLRDRLLAVSGGRALLPQVTVSGHHASSVWADGDGVPRTRVHLDSDLETSRGTRKAPLPTWAITVESLPGYDEVATQLVRRLRRSLADPDHGRPVTQRGDALDLVAEVSGVDPAGWRGPPRPDLDRSMPALVGVRAVLRSFATAIDANWQGTIDHIDDEFLHDLRIGVRQTRSLLGQARRILPSDVRANQRTAFQWLGTITSPARDLDVYVAGWGELTALLDPREAEALEPVLAHLAGQRAVAHEQVQRALCSHTAARLWDRWQGWLDLPEEAVRGGREATKPLGRVIGRRILAAQEQVLARGRAITRDSPADHLHELRKDAKRLRYLLDGFGHLGGQKRAKEVLRHLKDLQDNLGAHQDAEVQAGRLRRTLVELHEPGPDHPGGLPQEALAAGDHLAAALEARQGAAREEFADRFAAYDRRKARRSVDELVERMAR